ncbi:ATP-binding cassette domain-containing protein [Candidatus Bipolaricaulota bacterium]|nr:ATP-binding cassette domain-containing protein [Candidatus Bipolaricaulota bacterium]
MTIWHILNAERASKIETLELCKTYAKGRIVANDRISLRVEDGKIFCLLGLNGARKTTLIKIFATLVLPTSGTARVRCP